jgi:hypothetical protein
VELKRKSKPRLRAIMTLHARWIAAGQSGACVYVCGDEEIRRLVVAQAALVGLGDERRSLRVELLEAIKELAREASERVPRGTRAAGASQ